MVHTAFPDMENLASSCCLSGFAGEECSKVVFGDQPAASCLYRPELAGAQQVMDELPGDAQWFSDFVRTVDEPLNEGVARRDLAHDSEQVPRMSVASSRAIAFVLSSTGSAASGTAMSLPPPRSPARAPACILSGDAGSMISPSRRLNSSIRPAAVMSPVYVTAEP